MRTPRVLLITDEGYGADRVIRAIGALGRSLPPGSFAVQLREKAKARDARREWARELRRATRAVSAGFVVNGDVPLAREVSADGVHFGAGATPQSLDAASGLWRSTVAHVDADVVRSRGARIDAVLVSPIFASPGKGPPRGLGAIERAVELAGGLIDVIALGGVGVDEAPRCFAAGAVGVAMIRAILGADDPAVVARALAILP